MWVLLNYQFAHVFACISRNHLFHEQLLDIYQEPSE